MEFLGFDFVLSAICRVALSHVHFVL